ncbi:hypothetical protein MM1S1540310_1794 [Mycobacteroides abscessus subsp. bolletii 1S-154-0310]|uniref:Uncharacterized protein n=6 Tax=Mycobacteroides abscessus TaxID=36809 RepID=X8DTS8_9MYCO|nr:hypothetical protein MASS_2282 [Mycobacteroides abscessus subsp. bolletii 50594]EIU14747.1 hypothetical protein MA5S0304_1211 [Mycobacteroides abscessus 5S-0304]EIU15911.1 hypothetical protein MA5S0421_1493 [Mycobacteroides abscessus 5S-0421]EIU18693.1 hypothetical protein MA5S0422_1025 [Mycobacteroides abscessus 5S-0422]EIU27441.1 hypothetical protein MA5S0817_1273 [Mycobacteroides abscessus 5S-0817]EIU28515.1 hypothetical protein MA5S0708_1718 [Mycobacteroides abscessus 5S-0708]EIU32901.
MSSARPTRVDPLALSAMTTPNDVARQTAGPDPDEVRSRVQALLGQLDSPVGPGDTESDLDLENQAQILEQAHDVLVRALESAEQG